MLATHPADPAVAFRIGLVRLRSAKHRERAKIVRAWRTQKRQQIVGAVKAYGRAATDGGGNPQRLVRIGHLGCMVSATARVVPAADKDQLTSPTDLERLVRVDETRIQEHLQTGNISRVQRGRRFRLAILA